MLATSIIVIRKHRSWYSTTLVVAAVLVLLLPIISQVILNNVMELAEQIKAMSTQQQQQDALAKNKQYIETCNVYLKWLNDGRYLASMAFAFAIFITIGALLPKSSNVVAQESAPTVQDKAPDAS